MEPTSQITFYFKGTVAINLKIEFYFNVRNFSTCPGRLNVERTKFHGTHFIYTISWNICYSKYEGFPARRFSRP
jgi:hypothetical protein